MSIGWKKIFRILEGFFMPFLLPVKKESITHHINDLMVILLYELCTRSCSLEGHRVSIYSMYASSYICNEQKVGINDKLN